MLSFHRDRILQAANHFGWTTAATSISGDSGLRRLTAYLGSSISTSAEPLRVKILINFHGKLSIENNKTPIVPLCNLFPARLPAPRTEPVPEPAISSLTGGVLTSSVAELTGTPLGRHPWVVTPDIIHTLPSSYTSHKTTSRGVYDAARLRAQIHAATDPKEVLLISSKGEIMEGSLTTPYFWRNGKWTTPLPESGGQLGTTRRWAIEQGLCREDVVTGSSLIAGEDCWVSNGVRGFLFGKIHLS